MSFIIEGKYFINIINFDFVSIIVNFDYFTHLVIAYKYINLLLKKLFFLYRPFAII
ncbi:hypothetical protein GLOIN_2v1549272 [Rhizophagus irregularis DAOM 181602=DAOM 197198]|uniref:Uncharacterized protein n=1 Tax=Rhizophagus irregularis (strain DAOM 181602 / DAOM 197198 / MUCL 43194) TaxID=747089 RepID=A0A2P4QI30_RHIID|nr:hypothetical protein GLOIN_2v1549272 [Rhizophagus irregularis DAOM 181602=DAOM 197198]POG77278.1 hypothetical protein GLOIN_2v1549272 [Rhizophagus irregularis DAOM 181602=DAOM 197198]|eukprot:XP_025184144.1 hypothetical protein GLOIN_2v1549272 [Rhizophagus irregularis DAOM 181602=DAOM 197198]